MHPSKAADAKLEIGINDPHMVMMPHDGSWWFWGVPIRETTEQSTWTLAPVDAQ